jgi:hypothetical protein
MESLENIKDSVETSVNLKLFSSRKTSSYYHIFNSKIFLFPIANCAELDNFNPARLSNNPYPKENRPRGKKDLESVLYSRKIIQKEGQTEPIWIALKKGNYTLLDGAHRIVATYLEKKETIPAFVIDMDSPNNT